MKAIRMHPAYLAVEAAERAWSADKEQAAARATAVIHALVARGIITDGEWVGGCFCKTPSGYSVSIELRGEGNVTGFSRPAHLQA